MRVIVAPHLGMCFGVRDAIAAAHTLPDPAATTVYGELVHNRQVLNELAARGFTLVAETNRAALPPTPQVMITAHGLSDRERQRLILAGKTIIDTTCPLVHRVHAAAQQLQRNGWFVIVIGKPDHVEVRGIVGDLDDYAVVAHPSEVITFAAARLGIVCQTTTPPDRAAAIQEAVVAHNPGKEIRFIDTICRPTRARQEAALALLEQADALVVVGGRNSNNTRQLVALAHQHAVPAFHVETAADLDPNRLARFAVVGLTAGTSTPNETIEAVHRALLAIEATEPARPTHEPARQLMNAA